MKDLLMSLDELTILTNDLYGSDKRHFKVVYPFYGESLFVLDMQESQMTSVIDRARLDNIARDLKPASCDMGQMIQFRHFTDCLIASNVLEYRNEEDMVAWLRDLVNLSRNPSLQAKPFAICADTNILYSRYISRHLSFPGQNKQPFNSGFRYALCDIVREEIDHHVEHKYSDSEIECFKSTFKRRDLLNEFRHRCDHKARLALLAANECQFLRQELKAAGTTGKNAYNSEQNDREIARSYVRYARENNCEVYLITADEKMVAHARTVDIPTKQLLVPTEVPKRLKVNPWSVKDLLYELAVALGAISLENNEAILLLGEWKGKGSEDYSGERVKVLIADEERYNRVRRELETCRKIRQIKGQLETSAGHR